MYNRKAMIDINQLSEFISKRDIKERRYAYEDLQKTICLCPR